jgi:integrase
VAHLVDAPAPKKKPMKTLTPEQVRAFLAAIQNDRLYPLYLVAITGGLRQGELIGLRWEDVDLDHFTIRVTQAIQRVRGVGRVVDEPKSDHARRAVTIPPFVVEALRAHKKAQEEWRALQGEKWQEHGLVFPSVVGTPVEARNLVRHFKNLLSKHGLPDIRFHDLRHTAATLLLTKGVHPKIVQEMLGHSSITLTLDTFSHVLPGLQKEAANYMQELVG